MIRIKLDIVGFFLYYNRCVNTSIGGLLIPVVPSMQSGSTVVAYLLRSILNFFGFRFFFTMSGLAEGYCRNVSSVLRRYLHFYCSVVLQRSWYSNGNECLTLFCKGICDTDVDLLIAHFDISAIFHHRSGRLDTSSLVSKFQLKTSYTNMFIYYF